MKNSHFENLSNQRFFVGPYLNLYLLFKAAGKYLECMGKLSQQ